VAGEPVLQEHSQEVTQGDAGEVTVEHIDGVAELAANVSSQEQQPDLVQEERRFQITGLQEVDVVLREVVGALRQRQAQDEEWWNVQPGTVQSSP